MYCAQRKDHMHAAPIQTSLCVPVVATCAHTCAYLPACSTWERDTLSTIFVAAGLGDTQLVSDLAEQSPDLWVADEQGRTVLHIAALQVGISRALPEPTCAHS